MLEAITSDVTDNYGNGFHINLVLDDVVKNNPTEATEAVIGWRYADEPTAIPQPLAKATIGVVGSTPFDLFMKIDSRQSDEKDDTPVLITRGLLKQLLHQMFNRTVEVPFIEEGKVIEGLLINADNKFEIGYTDGTMSECDTWAEIIE